MLFRIAVALFCVGVGAAIATLVPIFTGSEPLPLGFYLASMLAPVGFALMLLDLWRNARRDHHTVEGSQRGV